MIYVTVAVAVVAAASLAIWQRAAHKRERAAGDRRSRAADGSLQVAVTVRPGAGERVAAALRPVSQRAVRTEVELSAARTEEPGTGPTTVDRITITTSEAPEILEGVLRVLVTCSYSIAAVDGRQVELGSDELGRATVTIAPHPAWSAA